MSRRIALGICVVALFAAGCRYQLPPRTPAFHDLGFSMPPTGCAAEMYNGANLCFVRDLDAAARAGVRWVRIDDSWTWVQPNQPGPNDNPQADCQTQQLTHDCWNWRSIDERVRGAEPRGMKVLLVPTYAPAWAALSGCKSLRCGPDPARIPDYAHFVDESVKRYGPLGVMGTHVTSWEIWNEPNGPGFSPKADPAEYTRMLQAAYRVITSHPTSRSADVITGGTAPAANKKKSHTSFKPLTWLTCLYDNSICDPKVHNSIKGFFTAVGHHPYSGTAAPLAQFNWNAFRQSAHLHEVMQSNGDGAKKIWATEIGYSSDKNPSYGVGTKRQADLLVTAVIDWHRWTFAGPMFLFNVRDGYNPAETDSRQPDAEHDKFTTAGMLNYDYSAKPAAYAVLALTKGNIKKG